jgi:NTE family protein
MNALESEPMAPPLDRRRRAVCAALGAAVVAPSLLGCATPARDPAGSPTDVFDEPGFIAPPDGTRRRIALVLSGGSARGFAHLGMLRVLEREGLRLDLVVGTSAGAIVGAMVASGMPVRQIESAAEQIDWSMLFDFNPVRAVLTGLGLGIVPGARLEQFLRAHLRTPIEGFPLAFAAVATDMENGDTVPLNHGDAARAVRASCAVPGVYAPVRARGRLLGDGQIVSPLPVLAAHRLGAVRTLALDVVYPPQHSELSGPVSMLFQSQIVSGWRHLLADLVIAPEIRTTTQLGLASRSWLVDAGEKAAQARVEEIRALFSDS